MTTTPKPIPLALVALLALAVTLLVRSSSLDPDALETAMPDAVGGAPSVSARRARAPSPAAESEVTPAPLIEEDPWSAPGSALEGVVRTASGRPLEGARFRLVDHANGRGPIPIDAVTSATIETDATSREDGRFSIPLGDVEPPFVLEVAPPFAGPTVETWIRELGSRPEIVFPDPRTVRVRVVDQDGNAIPSARVEIDFPCSFGGRMTQAVDADGRSCVTYLFPKHVANVALSAFAPGHVPESRLYEDLATDDELQFVLEAGLPVHVTVRDARSGEPVDGAAVRILDATPLRSGFGEDQPFAWTDHRTLSHQGVATLVIPRGEVDLPSADPLHAIEKERWRFRQLAVWVIRDGYQALENEFTVDTHRHPIAIDVELEPSSFLTGRLVDEAGDPVRGHVVIDLFWNDLPEIPDDRHLPDTFESDRDGRFSREIVHDDIHRHFDLRLKVVGADRRGGLVEAESIISVENRSAGGSLGDIVCRPVADVTSFALDVVVCDFRGNPLEGAWIDLGGQRRWADDQGRVRCEIRVRNAPPSPLGAESDSAEVDDPYQNDEEFPRLWRPGDGRSLEHVGTRSDVMAFIERHGDDRRYVWFRVGRAGYRTRTINSPTGRLRFPPRLALEKLRNVRILVVDSRGSAIPGAALDLPTEAHEAMIRSESRAELRTDPSGHVSARRIGAAPLPIFVEVPGGGPFGEHHEALLPADVEDLTIRVPMTYRGAATFACVARFEPPDRTEGVYAELVRIGDRQDWPVGRITFDANGLGRSGLLACGEYMLRLERYGRPIATRRVSVTKEAEKEPPVSFRFEIPEGEASVDESDR